MIRQKLPITFGKKPTELPLRSQARLPVIVKDSGTPSKASHDPASRQVTAAPMTAISALSPADSDKKSAELHRALRNFHLLLRSERLYEKNHPQRLGSLETAYHSLRQITQTLGELELHVERGGIEAPGVGQGHLPDARGEMQALAADLLRAGIRSVVFSRKFHVGELDTLTQLMRDSLLESEGPATSKGNAWWLARLLENRVEGISINTQTEHKVDTVLASLIG